MGTGNGEWGMESPPGDSFTICTNSFDPIPDSPFPIPPFPPC